MPTPSRGVQGPKSEVRGPESEWAARPARPPRSIFGNYRPPEAPASLPGISTPKGALASSPPLALQSQAPGPQPNIPGESSLQCAIDLAVARSFLYRFLAQAYEDPTQPGWEHLSSLELERSFRLAVDCIASQTPTPGRSPDFQSAANAFASHLKPKAFEPFLASYLAAFGHAARGRCPLNEIEYGDIKADPLFQPHRLADLAAFYHAFGLDVAEDADERHDHISLELEFLCVLAAKEAYALEHQLEPEDLALCRGAQKRFLREHLGRWTPAFARRLARLAGDTPLGALANLTRVFVETECMHHGIAPGSEDLLLRPVDAAAETMCNSCGVTQLPPGALAQP